MAAVPPCPPRFGGFNPFKPAPQLTNVQAFVPDVHFGRSTSVPLVNLGEMVILTNSGPPWCRNSQAVAGAAPYLDPARWLVRGA